MNTIEFEDKNELNKWLRAAIFPFVFVVLIFLFKLIEQELDVDLAQLGVLPLNAKGLIGVFTSPLIHKDWEHVWSNALPLFTLGTMLAYFHRSKYLELFLAIYIISGLWLWIFGRPAYHIGASGLVFALAAYHITYGFVIRNPPMLAIAFLVLLFYGSMFWFVLPLVEEISWEAHLCGTICGILLAIYLGQQHKKSILQVSGSMHFTNDSIYGEKVNFIYHYKAKEK